jgi:hypothetical protein
MPRGHRIVGSIGLALLLGLFALTAVVPTMPPSLPPASPPPSADGAPHLAVLLVFDQMRGDYLSRWQELFGKDGFRRLTDEGAWFQNCHYPYAYTVTGAGHASLACSCSPWRHGIIGNDWYDREAGKSVYCVGSDRYERVPPAASGSRKAESASPDRLLTPTLADALKEATGGQGRVVSLSMKDRSAVLPGGRQPDACCWFDLDSGDFITSTYYRDSLPRWVADYNHSRLADRWQGSKWKRLRPDLDYQRWSGPDDVKGEGTGVLSDRTFPHSLGGLFKLKSTYYKALYNSPFGNDVLLDLTRRAISDEELGRHQTPDLLCVSFSCNDSVGHLWGPDSQEVLDVTLRSDLIVRDLLACLDEHVGKGRYVVALSADHGVAPLPEVSRAEGRQADRIQPAALRKKAEEYLEETFPGSDDKKGSWVEALADSEFYLNRDLIRRRGLEQGAVEEELARWLKKQAGIQTAYTRSRLLSGIPADDAIGQKVLRSFYPARSGDVLIVFKPYSFLSSYLTGTTHGTPYPYDTHVPLVVYGPGIRRGVRSEAVTPQAAAAILARALGIAPPAQAEATVPRGLFERAP